MWLLEIFLILCVVVAHIIFLLGSPVLEQCFSPLSCIITPLRRLLDISSPNFFSPMKSETYRYTVYLFKKNQASTSLSLYMILMSHHVTQPPAPPLHLAFVASFLFMVSVHPTVPSSLPLLYVP